MIQAPAKPAVRRAVVVRHAYAHSAYSPVAPGTPGTAPRHAFKAAPCSNEVAFCVGSDSGSDHAGAGLGRGMGPSGPAAGARPGGARARRRSPGASRPVDTGSGRPQPSDGPSAGASLCPWLVPAPRPLAQAAARSQSRQLSSKATPPACNDCSGVLKPVQLTSQVRAVTRRPQAGGRPRPPAAAPVCM
jgi:hypothetical protein